MTIKKVGWMEDWNTNNYINEVQGGQEVMLNLPPDLKDLIKWWREWKPVFESKDPTVVDLLNQAKVISKVV